MLTGGAMAGTMADPIMVTVAMVIITRIGMPIVLIIAVGIGAIAMCVSGSREDGKSFVIGMG